MGSDSQFSRPWVKTGLFIIFLCFQVLSCFGDDFESRASRILVPYYDASLPEKERLALVAERLETSARSKDPIDRQAAALANAGFADRLERGGVIRVFRKLVTDADRDVRYSTLFHCITCTGFPAGLRDSVLGYIKPLMNDPDPEVRALARAIYPGRAKTSRHSR